MKRSSDPLFAPPKKKHPAILVTILFLVLVLAITLVLNRINNSRVNLITQRVTIARLPSSMENFRILHISDLHGLYFGAHQERIGIALQDAYYHVVCVTGDITGPDGSVDAFLALLDLFKEKNVPVYFVTGDEDPAPFDEAAGGLADYIRQAQSHGGIYLDAPVRLREGKNTLWLAPEWAYTLDYKTAESECRKRKEAWLAQPASRERELRLDAIEYQLDQYARIRQARLSSLEDDVHIVMIHHPMQASMLESLQAYDASDINSYVRTVSLVLAGHYVGGQWRLPGIGAVRAPLSSGLGSNGWFPEDRMVTGLSTVLGVSQYISPGLGTSSAIGLPSVRLFNTPAVTILILTQKLTQ